MRLLRLDTNGGGLTASRGRWAVIAAANIGFWVVAAVHEWIVRGPFVDLGGDWARFWGAARAFNAAGPSSGYRLPQIAAYMQPLARYIHPGAGGVRPGPVPYPPLFLDLIAPFTTLPPVLGFAIWTAFNAALALVVARHLAGRFQAGAAWGPTLALFSYFPLMLSLFTGQVTVLLLVCLLAAVIDFERGHELRAGMWSGFLILKPQYVAVLGLVYLAKRRFAAVAGFALGAGVILGGSIAAGGVDGVAAYGRMLVTAYPGYAGGTGLDPRGMIGWRGLLATAFPFLPAGPSVILVAALSLLTLAVLPLIWRGAWEPASDRFARQLMATVAATLLVAYHDQPHGATLLLVPGALVLARGGVSRTVRALLLGAAVGGPAVGVVSALALGKLWLVGPATTAVLVAVLAALAHAEAGLPGRDKGAHASSSRRGDRVQTHGGPAGRRPSMEAG